MLVSTDLRVSEICCRIGMDDAADFDHLFRRYFGCNPTVYRTTRRTIQGPAGRRAAP
jgi:AraC-like DNA-binding protein